MIGAVSLYSVSYSSQETKGELGGKLYGDERNGNVKSGGSVEITCGVVTKTNSPTTHSLALYAFVWVFKSLHLVANLFISNLSKINR